MSLVEEATTSPIAHRYLSKLGRLYSYLSISRNVRSVLSTSYASIVGLFFRSLHFLFIKPFVPYQRFDVL